MRIPFDKLPLDVRRRAARALAGLVGSDLSPRAGARNEPRFGQATPIYRPDLADVAYWEIEIEGVATALPLREGPAKEYDRGFLVLATGAHDVPVPHFSLDLAPPSHQLEALGGALARVVKVDSLCYAGEDDRGTLVAHLGTMPPKLTGMPAELPARLPAGYATTATASGAGGAGGPADGDKAEPQRRKASKEKRPVSPEPWRSWNELVKGYADSYRHQLAELSRRAAPRWEIEKLTEAFGEGIRSGQPHVVLLLAEGEVSVSGPGADFVQVQLNPQPLPPRVVLTPKADVSARDTSFDLHLRYAGEEEVLRFFVVPEQAPTEVLPTTALVA